MVDTGLAGDPDVSGDDPAAGDVLAGWHGSDCWREDAPVCDKSHEHGEDCYRTGFVDQTGAAHDNNACHRFENRPVVNMAAMSAAKAHDFNVVFQWATVSGIDAFVDSDGVTIWDVGSTSFRYAMLGVSVDISVGTVGANGFEIRMPYEIDTGRLDAFGNKIRPQAVVSTGVRDNWQILVDKKNNTVIYRYNGGTSGNSHETFTLNYKLDCWSIASGDTFCVDCYAYAGDDVVCSMDLYGRMLTGLDLSISGGSSEGFVGNVGTSAYYLDRYNSKYETYFGLAADKFSADEGADPAHPDYVYDVAVFVVTPIGQQPYDIEGMFVPGRYPRQGYSSQAPYGWDGELIGAVLSYNAHGQNTSSSFSGKYIPVKINSCRSVRYSDLPGSVSGASDVVSDAGKHMWNAYSFSVGHDEFPIVSDFSDTMSVGDKYYLYMLVRYPNGDSIKTNGSGSVGLYASINVEHRGLDGDRVSATYSTTAYTGVVDNTKYVGNVYAARYNSYSRDNDGNALGKLECGRKPYMQVNANFYCFNENRSGASANNDYTIEGIADVHFICVDDDDPIMLDVGDYRISDYYVRLMDAPGYFGGSVTGSWSVSWPDISKPVWISEQRVDVYGSTELYGNDNWQLLQSFSGNGIPWTNATGGFSGGYSVPTSAGDIVRLKAVYSGGRFAVQLGLAYGIELLPDGDGIKKAVAAAEGLDSITLVCWCAETAYESNAYRDHYADGTAGPDLNTQYAAVSGATGNAVRAWDRKHPYSGYAAFGDSPYPYRAYIHKTLTRLDDGVGMTVSQGLFDSAGKLVGSYNSYGSDVFSLQTDVQDVSKIAYNVHGLVTDYSVKEDGLIARRSDDVEAGVVSAYTSTNQRFYILLPEGFEYKENSIHSGISQTAMGKRLSALSVPGISLKYAGACTTDGWMADCPDAAVSVDTRWIGSRQLLVIDRPIVRLLPNSGWDSGINYGNWGNYPTIYGWGRGISFEAVPIGNSSLPTGSYETLFMHQFLTDARDEAIDLSMYNGEIYDSASDAFGVAIGSSIDSYVMDGDATITAVSVGFHNKSGSGSSYADTKIDMGNGPSSSVALSSFGDTYRYEFSYHIDEGTSTNVVIWNSIENYFRNGVSSDWKGIVLGVDINGTGARVFVNDSAFDADTYVSGNADYTILQNGQQGWYEAGPDTDWANVKSVAFWFDGKTFDASNANASSATVYLNMKAPEAVDLIYGQSDYVAYNEVVFSDHHGKTGLDGTALGKFASAVISVDSPINFDPLPSTGGTGTGMILIIGMSGLLAGAATFMSVRKRRED